MSKMTEISSDHEDVMGAEIRSVVLGKNSFRPAPIIIWNVLLMDFALSKPGYSDVKSRFAMYYVKFKILGMDQIRENVINHAMEEASKVGMRKYGHKYPILSPSMGNLIGGNYLHIPFDYVYAPKSEDDNVYTAKSFNMPCLYDVSRARLDNDSDQIYAGIQGDLLVELRPYQKNYVNNKERGRTIEYNGISLNLSAFHKTGDGEPLTRKSMFEENFACYMIDN